MNNLRLKPKVIDTSQKEIEIIEDEYLLLSIEFEAKLFASEKLPHVTYKALFEEYWVKWYQWCQPIISGVKFKYIDPDPNMFFDEYRPLI